MASNAEQNFSNFKKSFGQRCLEYHFHGYQLPYKLKKSKKYRLLPHIFIQEVFFLVWNFCLKQFSLKKPTAQILHFNLFLQLLLVFTNGGLVLGEGNVGCNFVRTLCVERSEICYDDNIFGKCVPSAEVDLQLLEKTTLNEDQTRLLASMLEELQGAGLGWDHPYVQCRIQGSLFSLQRQAPLPPNLCGDLASIFPKVRKTEYKYSENPNFFYSPIKKQSNDVINKEINNVYMRTQFPSRRLRHDPSELEHFGKFDAYDSQLEIPRIMKTFLETERERVNREQILHQKEIEAERQNPKTNQLELYHILAGSEPDPQPYQRKSPSAFEELEKLVDKEKAVDIVYIPDKLKENNEFYFPMNYEPLKRTDSEKHVQKLDLSPSLFSELSAKDEIDLPINSELYSTTEGFSPLQDMVLPTYKRRRLGDIDRSEFNNQKSLNQKSLTPLEQEALLAHYYPKKLKSDNLDRAFTEGGVVLMPEKEVNHNALKQSLLAGMWGFSRHERLDVKKPGPIIGPSQQENNYQNMKDMQSISGDKEQLPAHIASNNEDQKKKKVFMDNSDEDHVAESVETEYTHVLVKNPIDSWNDGVRIITELANILHMQGYFTSLNVQSHEVSFRVDSKNPEHKTATDIARIINENRGVKNNILRRLGVTVLYAGVGDNIRLDKSESVSASHVGLGEEAPNVTHIMAYMFAGAGVAAVIVIFVTLLLLKRHDKRRNKLGDLQSTTVGVESCSKDYQDLCRARMAGKGNALETVASSRITSLNKENDKPPSSRSSTSSWSEEPALTNMDISTGHMVLSYMEDHLRNKGRLQREWEALCRYEAEPSARDAALQPQCSNLNRPGAPLPYDHSRVVLNHLANAEGLDYINASTITDHDPRAPAYVAAQGPLPSTLTHFWQMIWEQGAVVIVALCRLQENGDVACARYWPEEGAEVYHIYEVHLVSEHIWCDDYLVRSFYLKNLRTSETRTVTQFHFLSWPQGGVPSQAKALLDFRRKVNKSYRGRSCPIVVHGSAGAGRTGAYILLDLVLGRMNKGAREIDIAATLEHLRDQRSGLVATRQQFEFVLMAVAEEVHAILKALPTNQSIEKRELDKDTTAAKEPTSTAKKEDPVDETAKNKKTPEVVLKESK